MTKKETRKSKNICNGQINIEYNFTERPIFKRNIEKRSLNLDIKGCIISNIIFFKNIRIKISYNLRLISFL